MQHFASNLISTDQQAARVLTRGQVTSLLASIDSRRFAYRARVEREKARDATNSYERMVHLRAAQLHRQLALSIGGREPFAAEVRLPSEVAAIESQAFANANGPRLRVLMLILMGAAAPLALLGSTSALFNFLAG